MEKRCPFCWKGEAETRFYQNRNVCTPCHLARMKEYKANNAQALQRKARTWRLENKESINQRAAERRGKKPEHFKLLRRLSYQRNRSKHLERAKSCRMSGRVKKQDPDYQRLYRAKKPWIFEANRSREYLSNKSSISRSKWPKDIVDAVTQIRIIKRLCRNLKTSKNSEPNS